MVEHAGGGGGPQAPGGLSRRDFIKLVGVGAGAATALALAGEQLAPGTAAADTAWAWYKTDPHVHSVISGDAVSDIGIISSAARAHGFDAMFLTDHQGASSFVVSSVAANHVSYEDDIGTKWVAKIPRTGGTYVATPVTGPVHSGTQSLHLAATAQSGEVCYHLKRGPNLRSGQLTLTFWVYPTRIDPGCGVYVSVSIGGDPKVQPPDGYTTQAHVISPGKSTVLVWQLGQARSASTDPAARVLTYPLAPFALNQWHQFTIDVSAALRDIPAADLPLDYNALTFVKMAAAATGGGTADAYFDSLHLDAGTTVDPAAEFVYRNSVVSAFDTPTFKVFPSIELGSYKHVQRFNFAITDPSQYPSQYTYGTDGVAATQQTGYPAMLNHPGMPGGASESDTVSNHAFGSDLMEVAERVGYQDVMVRAWDAILAGGTQLLGCWSSDMHNTAALNNNLATYIRAPALDFDRLLRSFYEGRTYLARDGFGGRVVFNLDPASAEPYPARYAVFVGEATSTIPVHLSVSAGLASGWTVRWFQDGAQLASDAAPGPGYQQTRTVALPSGAPARSYVRAEVRNAAATPARMAMTQPLVIVKVPGLPDGRSHWVERVITADGQHYNRVFTKGITSSSWSDASQVLSLALEDPAGALVDVLAATPQPPVQVLVDGSPAPSRGTLAEVGSATSSCWFYDPATALLHLRARHASSHAAVAVQYGAADTTPPPPPTGLRATQVTYQRVDLAWDPVADSGLDGYTVRRGGAVLATVGAGTTAYADTTVAAATSYSYTVEALDSSGNHSAPSAALRVTTPPPPSSFAFAATADTYADSTLANQTRNYGTATKLRADGSPVIRSYLKFTVPALPGPVTRATLKLSLQSAAGSPGLRAWRVSDTSWGEQQLTWATAPPLGAAVGTAVTGATGAWVAIDVSASVTGPGTYSFAVGTDGTTAISFAAREAGPATAPTLEVATS